MYATAPDDYSDDDIYKIQRATLLLVSFCSFLGIIFGSKL